MSFTTIKPKSKGASRLPVSMYNSIRIGFIKDKNQNTVRLDMRFGKEIADILGVDENDSLVVGQAKEGQILHVAKGTGDEVWKIVRINKGASSPVYKSRIRWDFPIPEMASTYIYVTYRPFKGGLLVFLPGATFEDKNLIVG